MANTQDTNKPPVQPTATPNKPTSEQTKPTSEQTKPGEHAVDRSERKEPPPGTVVTSQNRRVDEVDPSTGNDRDREHKLPGATQGEPSPERPRDRDKDRQEPMTRHKVGDEPEQVPQAEN